MGGTVVPPAVPPYLLKVQKWYRRACSIDSARGALSTPSEPLPPGARDCDHTQPQLIVNAQQTSIQGEHLVWVPPPLGRETAPNCQNVKEPKSLKIIRAACLQNETAPEKLLNRYEKRFEKREKRSERRSETRLKFF